ncbi:Crp/Fnr family transcriptional regulator [Dyadobacter sediminis]|uniref:Crp/Fnr family transcriptional regulator n=1 Tax=Dyadobacter sediminis TaxID=1493691 RepID=A0A5R9KC85_9BACT|nr:Crp/Fnr family transcriptional regulator [Dyadobacter sediminis]TLU92368.1 Crp/Fnr family transcriptional regulator [Dyadobacter sediminis]GGB95009.1 Crp/Fnr family transcriptional regulator [Dyadobacter sediminis]
MEEIISYMLQFGQLDAQQTKLIKTRLHEITLKKGAYFSEAGKIARQVGFLSEGVLRVCYYGIKGEEFTRCFVRENQFAVDLNSFYNEIPCSEYVEALTDCRMFVLSKPAFTELSGIIADWNPLFAKMSSSALMRKVYESSRMLSEDATTRYLSFLEIYPGLSNRIPLSALASYLGITQSSLSRIRKNIS